MGKIRKPNLKILTMPMFISFAFSSIGLFLIFLKMFDKNYIIEGMVFIGLSISIFYSSMSTFKMNETILIISDLLDFFSEKDKNKPQNSGFVNLTNISSKEDFENAKKAFPQVSTLIDGLFQVSQKNLSEMSLSELESELDIARENEDFEKASIIKELIKNKKQ